MNRTEIIQSVFAGQCWDVTNHYIDRPDHACFGKQRRIISECNGTSFYTVIHPQLVGHHEAGSKIEWPKASQIQRDVDGTIRLYGGGINQGPGELFLTLTPCEQVALPYCVKCDECRNVVRWCETVEESARGGYCDSCRAALDARYPERVTMRASVVAL